MSTALDDLPQPAHKGAVDPESLASGMYMLFGPQTRCNGRVPNLRARRLSERADGQDTPQESTWGEYRRRQINVRPLRRDVPSTTINRRTRKSVLFPRVPNLQAVGGICWRELLPLRRYWEKPPKVHRARGLLRGKLETTTKKSAHSGRPQVRCLRGGVGRTPQAARVRPPRSPHSTTGDIRNARSGKRIRQSHHSMPSAPREVGGHSYHAGGGV